MKKTIFFVLLICFVPTLSCMNQKSPLSNETSIENRKQRRRESIAAKHFKNLVSNIIAIPAYSFKKTWSSLSHTKNMVVDIYSLKFKKACKECGMSLLDGLDAFLFCVVAICITEGTFNILDRMGHTLCITIGENEYTMGSGVNLTIEFVQKNLPVVQEKAFAIWTLALKLLDNLINKEREEQEEL